MPFIHNPPASATMNPKVRRVMIRSLQELLADHTLLGSDGLCWYCNVALRNRKLNAYSREDCKYIDGFIHPEGWNNPYNIILHVMRSVEEYKLRTYVSRCGVMDTTRVDLANRVIRFLKSDEVKDEPVTLEGVLIKQLKNILKKPSRMGGQGLCWSLTRRALQAGVRGCVTDAVYNMVRSKIEVMQETGELKGTYSDGYSLVGPRGTWNPERRKLARALLRDLEAQCG